MAKRKTGKIPGVSFSAKRAFGVTNAKRNLARATGIPTTKAGRQRKIGKAVTGGGCLLPVFSGIVLGLMILTALVLFL